jgi:hypothetical protein
VHPVEVQTFLQVAVGHVALGQVDEPHDEHDLDVPEHAAEATVDKTNTDRINIARSFLKFMNFTQYVIHIFKRKT